MERFDVLIPASGLGSRLRPLTDSSPKALTPVHGKPILGWQLSLLSQFPIGTVHLVLGYRKEQIEMYCQQWPHLDFEFWYNPEFATTGCCVSLMKALPNLKQSFFYFNSDLLIHREAFRRLLSSPRQNAILSQERQDDGTKLVKVVQNDRGKILEMDLKVQADHSHEAVGPLKINLHSIPTLCALYNSLANEKKNSLACYSLFGLLAKQSLFYSIPIHHHESFEINTIADFNESKTRWNPDYQHREIHP